MPLSKSDYEGCQFLRFEDGFVGTDLVIMNGVHVLALANRVIGRQIHRQNPQRTRDIPGNRRIAPAWCYPC